MCIYNKTHIILYFKTTTASVNTYRKGGIYWAISSRIFVKNTPAFTGYAAIGARAMPSPLKRLRQICRAPLYAFIREEIPGSGTPDPLRMPGQISRRTAY